MNLLLTILWKEKIQEKVIEEFMVSLFIHNSFNLDMMETLSLHDSGYWMSYLNHIEVGKVTQLFFNFPYHTVFFINCIWKKSTLDFWCYIIANKSKMYYWLNLRKINLRPGYLFQCCLIFYFNTSLFLFAFSVVLTYFLIFWA